jgi:2-C-methyl-D-erythritol 4-phosphate cytidylyltransferase
LTIPTPAVRPIAAIVAAAGQSQRFRASGGLQKKVFATLRGRMVWEHAVAPLRGDPAVGEIIVVVDPADRPIWESDCRAAVERLAVRLVDGGAERFDSVRAGLAGLASSAEFVAIHDAARPCCPANDLDRLWPAVRAHGAAILAAPITSTVKRDNQSGLIRHTVDRRDLWEALTPQVARRELLAKALERWRGRPVTDDAQWLEYAGIPCALVAGSRWNLKITTAQCLNVAEAVLAAQLDAAMPNPAIT